MHANHCIFATEMNTSGGKTIIPFHTIYDYMCRLLL